jgi:hypothetical protein
MYLTIFLFLAWGTYFKSMGIIYILYYAAIFGYDLVKSSANNRQSETEDIVYEVPIVNHEQDIQTIEVTFMGNNDISNEQYNNMISDEKQPEIEEFSMNVSEYIANHRNNIDKAIKAFG